MLRSSIKIHVNLPRKTIILELFYVVLESTIYLRINISAYPQKFEILLNERCTIMFHVLLLFYVPK